MKETHIIKTYTLPRISNLKHNHPQRKRKEKGQLTEAANKETDAPFLGMGRKEGALKWEINWEEIDENGEIGR